MTTRPSSASTAISPSASAARPLVYTAAPRISPARRTRPDDFTNPVRAHRGAAVRQPSAGRLAGVGLGDSKADRNRNEVARRRVDHDPPARFALQRRDHHGRKNQNAHDRGSHDHERNYRKAPHGGPSVTGLRTKPDPDSTPFVDGRQYNILLMFICDTSTLPHVRNCSPRPCRCECLRPDGLGNGAGIWMRRHNVTPGAGVLRRKSQLYLRRSGPFRRAAPIRAHCFGLAKMCNESRGATSSHTTSYICL